MKVDDDLGVPLFQEAPIFLVKRSSLKVTKIHQGMKDLRCAFSNRQFFLCGKKLKRKQIHRASLWMSRKSMLHTDSYSRQNETKHQTGRPSPTPVPSPPPWLKDPDWQTPKGAVFKDGLACLCVLAK